MKTYPTEGDALRAMYRDVRTARRIRTVLLIAVLAGAFLIGVLWHPAWAPRPAHAATATAATAKPAKRQPVYKGTVTICYSPTSKAKDGQYLLTQWDLKAAAKAAGSSIGKVRVVSEREPLTTCPGEVHVWSQPYAVAYGQNVPKSAPFGVYRLVDCWQGRCDLLESQVSMSDRWGAAHTAAERQAVLVQALRQAIPR